MYKQMLFHIHFFIITLHYIIVISQAIFYNCCDSNYNVGAPLVCLFDDTACLIDKVLYNCFLSVRLKAVRGHAQVGPPRDPCLGEEHHRRRRRCVCPRRWWDAEMGNNCRKKLYCISSQYPLPCETVHESELPKIRNDPERLTRDLPWIWAGRVTGYTRSSKSDFSHVYIHIDIVLIESTTSVYSRLQVLGGKTHIWGVNLMHF